MARHRRPGRETNRSWRPRAAAAGGAALLLLTPALAGCVAGGGQPGHTFEIVEEDGVTIAISSAIPQFDGELFTYEKELVIRPDPDNPDSLLYQPEYFTAGPDGRFYVADRGNHRIVVFDRDGAYVASFGREGQGPGELRRPFLVEIRDDRVHVFDGRTTIFTLDGAFVDVIDSELGRFERITAGGLLSVEDTTRPAGDEHRWVAGRARVVDHDGEVVATVETGPMRSEGNLAYVGWPSTFLLPSDEILASTGTEPVIRWYGLDGELIREARIELPLEPVTEAHRAAVEQLWDRLIDSVEVQGEAVAQALVPIKEQVRYLDHMPFWSRPIVDDAGWAWLPGPVPDTHMGNMTAMAAEPVYARPWFRILDPRGEFVGVTEWPDGAYDYLASAIVGGRLLAMVWDEEVGEVLPTVYRIRPAIEGLVYP